MQVHYLPACFGLVEHESSSIEKSDPVIQMECCNRDRPKHLNLHVLWLKVHVGRSSLPTPDLIENDFERLFKARPFERWGNPRG
jgi:hypothetical protein